MMTADEQQPWLDAKVILEPLDSVLATLDLKLEREWPSDLRLVPGGREIILLILRTAVVTYRSVRFLTAEKPPDPNRKLEYCISVPVLNRSILDNLFTLIFLLEDLPARCLWYHKAGWREERLEYDRYQKEYGALADWQGGWLAFKLILI